MTTHEILVKARDLLEHGWIQSSSGSDDEGWCSIAALSVVIDVVHITSHPATMALREAVLAQIEREGIAAVPSMEPIIWWQDAPGRTKEEVLAVFDKAIAATAPEPADPFLIGGVEVIEEVHA